MPDEAQRAAPEVAARPFSPWSGAALAAFCLLSGSRWLLVEDAAPAFPLWRQSLLCAVVALGALPFALRRGGLRVVRWWTLAAAGTALFAAVPVLEVLAGSAVAHSGAALFSVAPVFVVVACGAWAESSRAAMVPALLGMIGGLLLLPFSLPATAHEAVGFGLLLLAVLVTAVGGVWLYDLLQGVHPAAGLVLALGPSAVFLSLCAVGLEPWPARSSWPPLLWIGSALDLCGLLLLGVLLRGIAPRRLASRFLLIPLLASLEGLVLLHGAPDLRSAGGLLLLAVAGGWLLLGRDGGNSEGLGLGLSRDSSR